jgi:hypothetical protein
VGATGYNLPLTRDSRRRPVVSSAAFPRSARGRADRAATAAGRGARAARSRSRRPRTGASASHTRGRSRRSGRCTRRAGGRRGCAPRSSTPSRTIAGSGRAAHVAMPARVEELELPLSHIPIGELVDAHLLRPLTCSRKPCSMWMCASVEFGAVRKTAWRWRISPSRSVSRRRSSSKRAGRTARGSPSWSPGGWRIAFASDRSGRPRDLHHGDRWRARAARHLRRRRRRRSELVPNGRRLVWASDVETYLGAELWVADALTGRNTARRTRNDVPDVAPTFSPDGRWIAYTTAYRVTCVFREIWRSGATGATRDTCRRTGCRRLGATLDASQRRPRGAPFPPDSQLRRASHARAGITAAGRTFDCGPARSTMDWCASAHR